VLMGGVAAITTIPKADDVQGTTVSYGQRPDEGLLLAHAVNASCRGVAAMETLSNSAGDCVGGKMTLY